MKNRSNVRRSLFWPAALALAIGSFARPAAAANLVWKGHTWNVTNGGMAGKCQGSPNNVSVDANGYLHLKITNNGGTWTAAEIFSTDKLGFGTYQWQIDGAIDRFEPWIVLGLFPYGPAAGIGGDGTNEIDIEYSVWGHAGGPNADWTDYPASGTTIGELDLHVLARRRHPLDVALHLEQDQHHELAARAAGPRRQHEGPHQDVDVRADEPDKNIPQRRCRSA